MCTVQPSTDIYPSTSDVVEKNELIAKESDEAKYTNK